MQRLALPLALSLLASPAAADIVWVGGVSNDVFDEANWDLSGSTVTVIDPSVTIDDNVVVVDAPAPLEIPNLTGQIRFQVGDGFTVTLDNSTWVALVNDGIGGVPGTTNGPIFNVRNGGHLSVYFIVNRLHLDLDETSTATFGGPATPINGATVDLTAGSVLAFTAETPADYINEHLSKTTVDDQPAVVDENILVVSDGGVGSIVTVIPTTWENFCTSTVNSTGLASTISATGSSSISANDLVLSADSLPAQPGIFIAGPDETQVPFFNGFLCVSPQGLQRFIAVSAPSGGVVSQVVDIASSVAGGLNVAAGAPYYFQRWNRDPAAGGGNANFSDGLRVVYAP